MIPAETIEKIVGLSAPTLYTEAPDRFMVVPNGAKVLDVSQYFPPCRAKACPQFTEAGAFIDYVNRFKHDNTLLFANITDAGAEFTAIIDYHGPAHADYCSHRAKFATEPTMEWKQWLEHDGKQLSQLEFAEWLENHQDLIVEPNGATLLELVLSLEGKTDVSFQQIERLKDGSARLLYDEVVNVTGATRAGAMKVPDTLAARIQIFHGMPGVDVTARLKYRLADRKISLRFETVNRHVLVRDAVADLVEAIEKQTELTALRGRP